MGTFNLDDETEVTIETADDEEEMCSILHNIFSNPLTNKIYSGWEDKVNELCQICVAMVNISHFDSIGWTTLYVQCSKDKNPTGICEEHIYWSTGERHEIVKYNDTFVINI